MYIHAIEKFGSLLSEKLKQQMIKETAKDTELQVVLKYITKGWPKRFKDVHNEAKPYFYCRDSLVYQDGLIMKGVRTVVPQSLRNEMRDILHSGHQGVVGREAKSRNCGAATLGGRDFAETLSTY